MAAPPVKTTPPPRVSPGTRVDPAFAVCPPEVRVSLLVPAWGWPRG